MAKTPKTERKRRAERAQFYERPRYRDLQERLAHNVERLRRKLGVSQEEAASRCGLPVRTYVATEHGDSNTTLITLSLLCDGFDVEPSELFRAPRAGLATQR